MEQTFAEATARNSAAVMLIAQADPGFDQTDGTRGPLRDPKTLAETDTQPDGFREFLLALRTQVIAFKKTCCPGAWRFALPAGLLLSGANRPGQSYAVPAP